MHEMPQEHSSIDGPDSDQARPLGSANPTRTWPMGPGECVMLVWNLGQVVTRIVAHIPWDGFTPTEKRRIVAALEVMTHDILRAGDRARRATDPGYRPSEHEENRP